MLGYRVELSANRLFGILKPEMISRENEKTAQTYFLSSRNNLGSVRNNQLSLGPRHLIVRVTWAPEDGSLTQ